MQCQANDVSVPNLGANECRIETTSRTGDVVTLSSTFDFYVFIVYINYKRVSLSYNTHTYVYIYICVCVTSK